MLANRLIFLKLPGFLFKTQLLPNNHSKKNSSLSHDMCLFALTIVVFQLGTVSLQSLNEKRVQGTACFGTGFHAFINANCSSTEKIYPIQLNAGAKFSSSGCPLEMESNATALLVQQCCFPDTANDCMASVNTDTPATASSYIETCVGRETCTTPQAFRMDVLSIATCNSSAFPTQTHYLYLDYYCVPNSKIGRFPTADLTNDGVGSHLYLQGSTYPFQIVPTTATCSLETDCSTNIVIYGLHVNFELDNVTCNQAITMNDTSGILYTVGCSDNDVVSGYRLRTLATSNDNYIEIYYTSLTSNQGLFWLAFKASGNLTINCPRRDPINQCLTTTEPMTTTTTTTTEPMTTTTTTEQMTTTTTTEPMTTTTTTEPMTTTTTTEPMTTTTTTEPMTTTTTTTTTTLPPSTGASSADEGSTNMIIIIVVVVAVSLILALVAVLVYRKCYKKKCGRNTDEEQSAARNDGQQDTNSLQRTSTITVSDQNHHENEGDPEVGDVGALPTIISPSTSEVNNVQHTDDKQQKRKKKKKKKRKVQSEENNEDVLHSDKVQPAASNIHKTEDYDEENATKRKKRHKRNDNSIYPEPSFEPDDVPTQDHATERNKSKRKKKRKKTRKPQENMTADDFEPDDVTTKDHATESNKSKRKKKRKKTRKHQENMPADGEDTGARNEDETLRNLDETLRDADETLLTGDGEDIGTRDPDKT